MVQIQKNNQMPLSAVNKIASRKFYRYNRYAYGLGWNIATYKGEEFIHCFGTYAGFRPHSSFMPEHNIGVVVLVNESTESVVLADLIANEIYDYLLGKRELNAEANPDIDEYEKQLKKIRERAASRTINTSIASNQPSKKLSSDQYTGTYRSDEFGEVKISLKDNNLVADWGTLSANLIFEKDNLFKADFMLFRPMNAIFGVDSNNEIQDLMLDEDKYVKVK